MHRHPERRLDRLFHLGRAGAHRVGLREDVRRVDALRPVAGDVDIQVPRDRQHPHVRLIRVNRRQDQRVRPGDHALLRPRVHAHHQNVGARGWGEHVD